jgi:hypothetical protein
MPHNSDPTSSDPAAQRPLVSASRRQELFELVADLHRLKCARPGCADLINTFIADVIDHASRTRANDHALVVAALEHWRATGLTEREIADETDVPLWSVRQTLAELSAGQRPRVRGCTRPPVGGIGRPEHIYFPGRA